MVEICCGILIDPDSIHFPSTAKVLRMATKIPDAGIWFLKWIEHTLFPRNIVFFDLTDFQKH